VVIKNDPASSDAFAVALLATQPPRPMLAGHDLLHPDQPNGWAWMPAIL